MIALLLVLLSMPARAGTIAIVAHEAHQEVPQAAVDAMLWHALYDRFGHDAVVVDEAAAVPEMKAQGLTTLLTVDVHWVPLTADLPHDGGVVGSLAPKLDLHEAILDGHRLVPCATWTVQGALALYDDKHADGSVSVVSLPQVALEEAVDTAIRPVPPPTWRDTPDLLAIPVVVVGDDEYRHFYGADWEAEADLRIERASALLAQAGLRLDIVGHETWTSPASAVGLSALLDSLASLPSTHPTAVRIGFTQQTDLADAASAQVEDVGRAYRPGRDVVVADQAAIPDHSLSWDVAEEGTAVAHEVLHALGIPHNAHPYVLMSRRKVSTVFTMAPGTRALAKAAAEARWGSKDRWTSASSLASTAEAWLQVPEQRVEYVAGNLLAGPDASASGGADPPHLAALIDAVSQGAEARPLPAGGHAARNSSPAKSK